MQHLGQDIRNPWGRSEKPPTGQGLLLFDSKKGGFLQVARIWSIAKYNLFSSGQWLSVQVQPVTAATLSLGSPQRIRGEAIFLLSSARVLSQSLRQRLSGRELPQVIGSQEVCKPAGFLDANRKRIDKQSAFGVVVDESMLPVTLIGDRRNRRSALIRGFGQR